MPAVEDDDGRPDARRAAVCCLLRPRERTDDLSTIFCQATDVVT
jgi:hypothetical protein